MRIWLLGGFKVSVGSRTIEGEAWRLRKAASLVKLLALSPTHRLHREQVMEALWPDLATGRASNNLRQALHAARRTLEPDRAAKYRYLSLREEQLALCPGESLWVDIEAFEEAAATARRSRDPSAYGLAIELYAGELLPGDRYEEWTGGRREGLRSLYLTLLLELAGLHEEAYEHDAGVEALLRATEEDPALEEAHVGLMRLYALSGRRTRALAQFERLRKVLSEKLGMEPGASTRRLYDEIAAGRFPPGGSAALAAKKQQVEGEHNLPAPRSSFVGREREILGVKRDLAMTRLLTLTGAGGCGKTRLALEAARDLVGAYPDGVWLVELAPLSEGTLVAQAVAAALEVQEQPDRSITEALVDLLRDRRTLLVLDNCEHLLDAVTRFADVLLNSCPHLKVLATSRENLNIEGELNWLVPSLSSPDRESSQAVEDLAGYDSVRLFVERAGRRSPSFSLTPENSHAVARICSRLEGIPLAIELAAARVGTFSLEQISERLEDSLELLTRGGRTAVARQRTLKGALDWSHDLLSEPERALFGRLSVFAGGWNSEASEAVGSGGGVEEARALDLLSVLVEKSLVVTGPTAEGEVRHRLLEPIRQYALKRLEESGEADWVRQRHASFFLELAERAESEFSGPLLRAWLGQLGEEHDNLRAALSCSLESENPGFVLRLAAALSWFWDARGHFSEGVRWHELALAKSGLAEPAERAGALYGLGRLLESRSDFEEAQGYLDEARVLYEALGNWKRVAESQMVLGWVAMYRGEAARARAYLEESLAAGRELASQGVMANNNITVSGSLNGLGVVARESGDFERAQALWEEALAMNRERGDVWGVSGIIFNMGYTELARGNHKQATRLLEESLTLSREQKLRSHEALALGGLGLTTTLRGDPEQGEALLKESLTICLELRDKMGVVEDLEGAAEAAGALGQHLRATRLWGAASVMRAAHPWSNTERMLHGPLLVSARSSLDEAAWEEAFAEGRAMTLEEAVEYALSEDEDADTPEPRTSESRSAGEPPAFLTRREREVASLVAQRLTNRQIAQELVLSRHTVDKHIKNILKKLSLHSREQVASHLRGQ